MGKFCAKDLEMAKYSKGQIDKAGNILRKLQDFTTDEIEDAQQVLTYWRYIHLPIINTFQAMLRNKISDEFNKSGFVAQRLKRSPSILKKLNNERNMRLSRMQDIAGVRAVMKKVDDVYAIVEYLKTSRHNHILDDSDDYIERPKDSGYRGVHLMFKYQNPSQEDAHGLKIEIQIRTQLQHVWATAVETLGTYLNISLKSGEGDPDILAFLALVGSAFAVIEKKPVVTIHKSYRTVLELFKDVIASYDNLRIKDKLQAYTVATQEAKKNKKAKTFLIILDTIAKTVTIKGYTRHQLSEANIEYTETEIHFRNDKTKEVVLVSTDKISALQTAYPNYYLDARDFMKKIDIIKEMVKRNRGNALQLELNL